VSQPAGSIPSELLPPGDRAGVRLPLWVAGRSAEGDMPVKPISTAAALFATLTFVFASATPALAAIPDNQQQLTTFDPAVNIDSCAGVSVNTHPETGKTLVTFIQPDAGEQFGGMLVVGLLDSTGALEGSLVQVSTTIPSMDTGDCAPPSLAAGPDGTWLVLWYVNTNDSDAAIAGQIISSTGTLVGTNFNIDDDQYTDIESVSGAWSATDERYLVTWKARVNGRSVSLDALNDQQVVGQFVDGTGSLMGSNFLVTNFAGGVNNNQDLAFGSGIWIAVSSEGGTSPKGQIITAAGLQGAAFDLSSEAQNYAGPGIVYNAAIGQFLATFWENTGEATKHLRLLSGSGTPLGSDTVYAADGPRPRAVSVGTGGYVLTWHGWDEPNIRAQAFDATLSPVGEQYQVSSDELTSAFRPEMACVAGGIVFAYWGRVAPDGGTTATNVYSNKVATECDSYLLPETNRDRSLWTTTLVILAGLTAAAGIGLRVRGAKRA